jgi:hypothetical protein
MACIKLPEAFTEATLLTADCLFEFRSDGRQTVSYYSGHSLPWIVRPADGRRWDSQHPLPRIVRLQPPGQNKSSETVLRPVNFRIAEQPYGTRIEALTESLGE